MKKLSIAALLAVATLAFSFFNSSSADPGERDDDQHWRVEHSRNELFDRQKALLSMQDELDYRIQELKRKIKFLNKDLVYAQSNMDQVQHELVIIRVKLL
jgi:peptidoglycan hydrolase CwlO-like protein